jgi:hypothetical protein
MTSGTTTSAIDPARLDLAREFKRAPFAKHSPELAQLLDVLRSPPHNGWYTCVCLEYGKAYALAQKQADWAPPKIVDERIYASQQEVEWQAFRRRWEAATGRKLEIE